ncbi:MAG: MotA/TolQ/ExbB proton channel family protein [Rikenellaceae bacterium]|nr:MotA/TolQ/ExbB proton channel family protein [Rikenellaceae bacterium]
MKKLFALLSLVGALSFATANLYAQEGTESTDTTTVQTSADSTSTASTTASEDEFNAETDMTGTPMHQVLKQKFLEGGAGWMAPILLCLVLGLAIVIERVIYLNRATINTNKLLNEVEEALRTGGIEKAKDVCRNTRGPVASIFYQGLDHYEEGMEAVERNVSSYGGVQMGLLESGLSWVTLFIAISPSLGFMGTVVGMVAAFDSMETAGDVSPQLVAGGIKIALLTTIAGLIAAVILQIFYNYLLAKVEGLVTAMEDASISLVDVLTKYNRKNQK